MRNCAVESCSNNPLRNPELSFFGLPKDSCVRDEWMEVLDLRDTEISEYIRVCELHFKAKDFCAGKKQLKHHAIPVLRLGRGKSIVGYNSDEEFAECNSDSDPEIVEIKKISREMSAAKPMDEMRIEDDEHKKEEDVVTESESGRRPSRRAARLAAEKIYNTVRQYGLADGVVKKELKFKERSEWHAVRAPPPNIDLLMECHEELLSAAQAEALLKSQLEYNMVVKTLRSLKAANARIVYTLGDESETPESNSAVTPKISSESSSALVSKQPSIVTLTTSRTVSGNELQQSTVVPKKNPVVPVKLAAASQQPLSSVVPTPSSLQTTPVYVGQPQTAIQLIQTVPQTPTILITTTPATTLSAVTSKPPVSATLQTSKNSPPVAYKVLVDPRTGLVVGTLPNETSIVQNSSTENQGSVDQKTKTKVNTVQIISSKVVNKNGEEETKEQESSIQPTQNLRTILPANSEPVPNTQDRSIPLITGGFKMVTAQSLLSVKPHSLYRPLNTKIQTQAEELKQKLEKDNFLKDPVKWLIKLKLIPDRPLCRWCAAQPTELKMSKRCLDGYVWACTNPKCLKTIPVTRLPFFSRFGVSLPKLLALIFHWSVQSDVEEILKDAEVDIYMVRSVWRALQEVCAKALNNKAKKLGGPGKIVEVTTAQIGRFFILGAMDRKTNLTRLKAVSITLGWHSPVFQKGLEPWLLPRSLIVSDDSKLNSLKKTGFFHVPPDPSIKDIKSSGVHVLTITDYMKKQLSNMFGKFWVNQLKLETIQGFLDELQWRERFGITSVVAFWNILKDIAEQSGRIVKIGSELLEPNVLSQEEETLSHTISFASSCNTPPSSSTSSSSSSSSSPDTPSVLTKTSLSLETKEQRKTPSVQAKSMKRAVSDDHSAYVSEKKRRKIYGEQTSYANLNEYYYARMKADEKIIANQERKSYHFKCHLCKKVLDNNIKVINHIASHMEEHRQQNLDLSDLTHCKYCFRDFSTPYSMQCHIESVHLKTNPLACLICCQAFSTAAHLIHHMKLQHVQSEMPYSCQVCQYRSSFHKEVIDHFHQVHSSSDKVLCPYCLKVYSIKFSANGHGYTQNYCNHMIKHQLKSTVRRCNTCCLVFFNLYELKLHKPADHMSMANRKGVIPIKSDGAFVVKNPHKKPGILRISKSSVIKATAKATIKSPTNDTLKSSQKYRAPDLTTLKEKFTSIVLSINTYLSCIECRRPMDKDHFKKYVSCGQCHYATNCAEAFVNHMICKHSDIKCKRQAINSLLTLRLEEPMYCSCGFSSVVGNKIAHHLINCGKKSCYCSFEKAIAATTIKSEPIDRQENASAFFPPLVVLDENEEMSINESFAKISLPPDDSRDTSESVDQNKERVKVEETIKEKPDMLNALGLVRRKSSPLLSSRHSAQDENSNTSLDITQTDKLGVEVIEI